MKQNYSARARKVRAAGNARYRARMRELAALMRNKGWKLSTDGQCWVPARVPKEK